MRDDTRIADALFRRIDETIILHAETEKSDAVPGFDRCLRTARANLAPFGGGRPLLLVAC